MTERPSSPAPLAPLGPLAVSARGLPALSAVLGRSATTLAVPEAARALVLAGLVEATARTPLLVATATTAEADRLAHDLAAYLGADAVATFPAWETLPFERVSPSVETMGRRLRTLWRLRDPDRAPRVVVTPVRALGQRLGPGAIDATPVVVRHGQQIDRDTLVRALVEIGYRREDQVEHRGEVAVRGSIVDVFPSTGDAPVRVDLWGDEVDRLTTFGVDDQRSVADVDALVAFGCRELLPTAEVRERAAALVGAEPWGREQWERLAEGLFFDGMESWLPWLVADDDASVIADLVGPGGQIVLVEPSRLAGHAGDLASEESDLAATLARTWGAVGASSFPLLHVPFDRVLAGTEAPVLSILSTPERPDDPVVAAGGWGAPSGSDELVARLGRVLAEGAAIVVAADTAAGADRIAARLADEGLAFDVVAPGADALARPGGRVVVAPLERGAYVAEIGLAVLCEADLTGRRRAHRGARPRRMEAQRFFEDLTVGDYVVHHHHGVGRYGGMVTRAIGDAERDYLLLEYRGGDRLYVPSDQIDAVRRYTGGETPTLHRLGGADFQKAKGKVRAAVREVAQELVVLYQRRVSTPGHAFAPDSPWQRELEEGFPYRETPDQLHAIDDVKADMEAPLPMDRLLCGDVGFGKTEVALRAAFKAVQDGKQVAVLVPTTLLAQQHGQTFGDRLAPYPVRVEVLSRFLTPGQARKVVAGVAAGEVDIVIGTHRLLSDDVRFADLGLLIVDEEQRFGVAHKELTKQLKVGVDVLTLTATPIPRTLEMSLTGIRDLSLLHTPPADRQPILTYVGEHDDRAVAEAVRRELLREGQVFFVHNRVADIEEVAERLHELVPEARIAIAHGQMDEGSLEKVVLDFWEGAYDVLVCTTIIESGIDMPTVNTLVVDRADLLGLGQLHQLRGRVGRAGQRAYAYLFTPVDRVLSEEAYERLRTIGESTELGSGFRIAMRDLEIRGAGNLLGNAQAGHIAAVGYDLYCQMVTEAVAELKGEPERPPAEIKLELPTDAHLPSAYVPREDQRLEAYRRLAAVRDDAEVADIRAEWEDRYGPPPPPAAALLDVASLRAACARTGVREVTVVKGSPFDGPPLRAHLHPVTLAVSREVRLGRLYPGAVYKAASAQLQLPLRAGQGAPELVAAMADLLSDLAPDPVPEAHEPPQLDDEQDRPPASRRG